MVLLYFIAVWALVTGIIEIILGWQSRDADLRWRLLLAGIFSILLGMLIYAEPMLGAAAIAWIIAAYAIGFGSTQLALALRLRARRLTEPLR